MSVSAASENVRKSSCCLGAEALLTLLGNYCHSHAIKTSITIGVVGNPDFLRIVRIASETRAGLTSDHMNCDSLQPW